MPTRGSLGSTDLTVDATLTGAFGFAWRATSGVDVVLAASAFDGTQPIESNWQGKFWYSAVPSLVTHLNISADASGAAQNAGSINAMSGRLSRSGWRTRFPFEYCPIEIWHSRQFISPSERRVKCYFAGSFVGTTLG